MKSTNNIRKVFVHIRGKEKTVIKISLDDDCANGHEDFSLTADIFEKSGNGRWVDVGGGCCHDHILKLRPDLKPFADLHLSDYRGVPMHAIANAFYWFAGWQGGLCQKHHAGTGSSAKTTDQCRAIFQSHIRATDAEMEVFSTCGAMASAELQMAIEDLGIPARWYVEAKSAIAKLEEWSGLKFETKSTRARFFALSTEVREAIKAKRASGYYDPAAVAARKAVELADKKQKAIAEVYADTKAGVEKLERKRQFKVWEIETFGPEGANMIYYDHTNEIAVNWSRIDRLMTRAEFDAMVANADLSKLPENVKFMWQERPKY